MEQANEHPRISRPQTESKFTRKQFLKLGGAFAVASSTMTVASACGTSVAQSGEGRTEYNLKLADSFPVGHPISEGGAKYLMKRATELTDGRVKFDYFPAEQMGTAESLIDLVQAGVVEIGMVSPAYIPAKLPLSGVGELPGLVGTSRVGSLAMLMLMREGKVLYRAEWGPKDIRPLAVGIIPAYEVMTKNANVKLPEDVKGLQLRSPGGTIDRTVNGIGAVPIPMPVTELYQAISRGTVDGTVLAPISAIPYRVNEVIGHSTIGAQLGGFSTTYSISERTWQRLPGDIQDALIKAGEDTTRNLGTHIDRENEAARRQMEESGVNLYDLSPQEQQVWRKETQSVRQAWVEDMQSIELPGEEALQAMNKALEKVREEQ